jgi:hypothetical protein
MSTGREILYLVSSAGAGVVVVSHGALVSDDLGLNIFLNGHSPPLQQPDKKMPAAAINNAARIVLLMFIYIPLSFAIWISSFSADCLAPGPPATIYLAPPFFKIIWDLSIKFRLNER